MYKTTTVVAFSFFLALSFGTDRVLAQDEEGPPTDVTTDSDNDDEVVTSIDWPELDLELAPLEEITPPPIQRSTGARGERQTYLQQGEAAPWPGVLFNPAAVAYLISEFEAFQLRAEAALERQRSSDWNRIRLEVQQLKLQITSDRRQADVVIEGLHRELERRIQLHKDYVEEQSGGFWNTTFGRVLKWGLVVIGAGAVGAVVGYAVGATTN